MHAGNIHHGYMHHGYAIWIRASWTHASWIHASCIHASWIHTSWIYASCWSTLRGSHGLSARRAWRTKLRMPEGQKAGPKGCQLEVGAQRAPRLLVTIMILIPIMTQLGKDDSLLCLALSHNERGSFRGGSCPGLHRGRHQHQNINNSSLKSKSDFENTNTHTKIQIQIGQQNFRGGS